MGTISSADLNTTGGTNSYTLTVAQLPPHTHGVRAIFHGQDPEGSDNCGTGVNEGRVFYGDDNIWPNCANPARVTFPTDPTGSGDPIDNRPAFIRLAFIMKL
jgi:microcystin-dependent protein